MSLRWRRIRTSGWFCGMNIAAYTLLGAFAIIDRSLDQFWKFVLCWLFLGCIGQEASLLVDKDLPK
jgi:hypothetical protein